MLMLFRESEKFKSFKLDLNTIYCKEAVTIDEREIRTASLEIQQTFGVFLRAFREVYFLNLFALCGFEANRSLT